MTQSRNDEMVERLTGLQVGQVADPGLTGCLLQRALRVLQQVAHGLRDISIIL